MCSCSGDSNSDSTHSLRCVSVQGVELRSRIEQAHWLATAREGKQGAAAAPSSGSEQKADAAGHGSASASASASQPAPQQQHRPPFLQLGRTTGALLAAFRAAGNLFFDRDRALTPEIAAATEFVRRLDIASLRA